jgi:hypothetical protein
VLYLLTLNTGSDNWFLLINVIIYSRWKRSFNKQSSRWAVQKVKAKKAYNHLRPLMRQILEMRMNDNIGMNQNMALEPDDPRPISRNITAIPPPHTQQLALQQRSMLSKDDPDKTIDYVFTE